MIKIFVNADTIKYYPKNNVSVEPGTISILGPYGNIINKYDVYAINLGDGLARKDVKSLTRELENTNTLPTFYCSVSENTIAKEPKDIIELKEEDLAKVLEDSKPDVVIDLDFSKAKPLQEYLKIESNQIGCLSKEDSLVSSIENFRDITWKDYIESLGTRSREQLTNATSYDEAINYLASELSTMKSMVNEFLASLEEKL